MEEILLHGKFQMLPSCSVFYNVTLTRQNIMFVEIRSGKQRKLMSILMDNIIGCKLYNSKLSQDVCSYFKVITLSKDKKNTRQKQAFTFRVNESEDRDDNNEIAENWTCMISWLIANPQLSVDELRAKEYFPPQRRYYVVINPKSGPGKSLQWFKNTIEPLFLEANIKYEVLITDYAGHLTEAAMTFDYTLWDAFVICSGDGLVFEFINGMMRRPDWQDMLQLPIGILPTGSGNALCASILYSAKEKFSVVNAVYVLLKGTPHAMDLFSVFSRSETFYGFLSVSWGIMSDIDIESEKLRAIGPLRFTVGALQRILNLRHYAGIFSYLPGKSVRDVESGIEVSENECTNTSLDNSFPTEDIEVINENVVPMLDQTDDSVCNELNPGEENTIESCEEEDLLNLCVNEAGIKTIRTDTSTIENSIITDNPTIYNSTRDELPIHNSIIHNPTSIEPDGTITSQCTSSNRIIYGPKCNLPDLDQPLPEDWVTVEGEFVNIILAALSHIGSDMHCAPGAYIDDGVLNLQYIKQGPKTRKMLKLLTSFETGKHVEFPEVEIEDVTAFRLTPGPDYPGNITIDGELINYEPIQGEIHPSLANIMMMPVTS